MQPQTSDDDLVAATMTAATATTTTKTTVTVQESLVVELVAHSNTGGTEGSAQSASAAGTTTAAVSASDSNAETADAAKPTTTAPAAEPVSRSGSPLAASESATATATASAMVKTLSLEHMEEAIVGVIDQAISDAAGVPLPPATPAVSLITSAHSLVETVSIVETTERAASITTETASVRAEISSSVAATTSKIASPDQPADASADGITAETREPAPQAGQPLTASDEALLDKDAMPGWPSFAQHQETQQQAADPECALDGDIEADTADEDSLVIVNSKSAEQDSDDGKLSSDREPSQQDKLAVGEESQVQCEVKPLLSHLDHIANAVNDRDDRAVSEDVSDNDEDDADDDDDKSRSGSEDDASEDDASENGDSSEYDESDNEETALLSTTEIASHGQESQAQAQERELSTTEKMLVDFMTPGVNGSAVVVMYLVLGCIASIFVTLYFATQNIHCLGVVAVVFILTGLITWMRAEISHLPLPDSEPSRADGEPSGQEAVGSAKQTEPADTAGDRQDTEQLAKDTITGTQAISATSQG